MWLIKEVTIVGLLGHVATVPCDMLVLQNPYIRDEDAFLGLSTLVQLRLLTDHHAGALMARGGLRIKMWASKKLVLKVLAHARSAAEVIRVARATKSTTTSTTTPMHQRQPPRQRHRKRTSKRQAKPDSYGWTLRVTSFKHLLDQSTRSWGGCRSLETTPTRR